MSSPKVFHFIRSFNLGGEQTYLIRLLNNFPDGYEHTVAYSNSELLKHRVTKKVGFIKLIDKRLSGFSANTYLMFFKFLRIFREGKYDVAILYSPASMEQVVCSLAATVLGLPVISIPQRPYENQERWERLVMKFAPLRWLAYKMVDRFVALGSYYYADFISKWKFPPEKVVKNYIGIELDHLYPDCEKRKQFRSELSLASDEIVLGFVGRLHPQKGLHKILELMKVLNRIENPTQIMLIVVGSGEYRSYYEEQVNEMGLHNVLFAGYRNDIDYVMNGIDYYVQATDHPLNGISSIEALASGRPVLTMVTKEVEIEMARDTVKEGVNGYFVRKYNLEHDTKRIAQSFHSERLKEMGTASRNIAEELFDIKKHVANFALMIDEIMGSKK